MTNRNAHQLVLNLTAEEAHMVRNAFLPANPNKLRSATPELRELAKRVIQALELHAAAHNDANAANLPHPAIKAIHWHPKA